MKAIFDPLPDVSDHVVEAKSIGGELVWIACSSQTLLKAALGNAIADLDFKKGAGKRGRSNSRAGRRGVRGLV
jgi:hypothetical protein